MEPFSMWWSRKDEKSEEDRARTQMELALSLHTNPYLEVLQELKDTRTTQEHKRVQDGINKTLIRSAVSAAERAGLISNEELKKYYLDETGTYIPKLKDN